jgi:hypothetical protein
MIEACARQALCATKIIHNFRDLLLESSGRRQGNLWGLHVAVVVMLYPEYHPPVVFHDHADRLIQMVEIRAANIAGEQTLCSLCHDLRASRARCAGAGRAPG